MMIFYYNYINEGKKDKKFNIKVLNQTKALYYIIQ